MNDSAVNAEAPGGGLLRRSVHALFVAGCFVIGCGGTMHLVGRSLPFPPLYDVGPRFEYFAAHKEDFDTIFIGSSRIRHQVVPKDFDAAAAALGRPTKSMNLGYSGMWPPESFYFLRQVLDLHPRHLRWVFIELMDHRFNEADHPPSTMRMVYWHDWQHTMMACRLDAEYPFPLLEKGQLMLWHAWLFLQSAAHPGRAEEWIHERYFPPKKKWIQGWESRAGFDPEEKAVWTDGTRAAMERDLAALQKSLVPVQVRTGFAADLQDIAADVRRAGAEPIFVIPPTFRPEENIVLGLPPELKVWAYNQPAQYPELYRPEARYDEGHLSEEGARQWSVLLARRFVQGEQGR